MAFELQKFIVIGARFTADPDPRKNFGGTDVIRFRIAFTGERRKGDNGEWDDKPVFMDCEAAQFATGKKIVDDIEARGKKGVKVAIEGTLKMETWEDKNGGGKRQAIKMKVTEIVWLEKTEKQAPKQQKQDDSGGYGGDAGGGGYGGGADDVIPF